MTALRVLVADDHELIREGLRKVFAREPGIEVVGEAASHVQLLQLLERQRPPDVVLMDPGMPGDGPVETLRKIAQLQPALPVLVLSMLPEDQVALRFIKSGAAGFVSKDAPPEELVSALRKVARGERYLSAELRERVAQQRHLLHERLSPREMEVLNLIATGKRVKEIAERLKVTVSTVHTHRARLLEKLDCRSDVDLTRYAVRHHLVS